MQFQPVQIMPYSMLVGQSQLKMALELTYLAPRIGGVLLSGQRGTGKSTVVRAFARMVSGELPVTLPINATEDRVVGGWDVNELLQENLKRKPGLLEDADGRMLYIDEVNLLDDHIVNIILDATSTGVLVVEREDQHFTREVRFTLVGTMNPSEGGLRPQLLDRFGLMVDVAGETDLNLRTDILQAVLDFDEACALQASEGEGLALKRLREAEARDRRLGKELKSAQERVRDTAFSPEMAKRCAEIGLRFGPEGHRGDYVMALAARARAAQRGAREVTMEDLADVAPLALQHRRSGALQEGPLWTGEDTQAIREVLGAPPLTATGPTAS